MSDSLSLSAYSFSFFPDLPIESYFPCSTASTSTTLASSPPHLSLDSTPPSSVASRGAGKPAESTGTSGESRKDGDGVEEPGGRRAGGGEGGGEQEAEDWFSARMAERASKREETLGKQAQVKMGMRRARSKSYEGDEAEVMKEKSSKKARTALYKPSPPLSPWSGASNPAVLPPSSQFKRAALSPNPFSSSVVLTLPPTPDFQRLFTPLVHLQRSLTFSDYAPYLLSSQPVDLSWSFAYGQAIINFLQSLSPPQKWSSRPQAHVFEASWFTEDVQRAMETQPDAEYIRRTYPLQRLVPPSSKARGKDGAKWMGIREVFRWIWGELADVWADVAWAVAELPLALLALCASRLSFLPPCPGSTQILTALRLLLTP